MQCAGGGVQVFGLGLRLHNRLVAVGGALAVIAYLWFRRKCTRAEPVMLFLAVTVGLSGLSVQYLAWILPFAVLCRRWRFVAIYILAAGFFALFYYLVPAINPRTSRRPGRAGPSARSVPSVPRPRPPSSLSAGSPPSARIAAYDVVRYRGPGIRPATKVWLARTLVEPGAANRVLNVTALSSRANARRDVA